MNADGTCRRAGRTRMNIASSWRFVCAIAILALGTMPLPACAWGAAGHRIIAAMAEERLSPAARAEARRLLAPSGAGSLADVAAWADEVREDPAQRDLARATSKFHFINFGDARCRLEPARDCANGDCVVAAVARYAGLLGDRSRSDAERAQALRFLVHFVGDAHQPLHAGYRHDRGGNNHQVRLGDKGTNLHSVWDFNVLASRKLGWRKYALRLQPPARARAGGTPRDWAAESCRITRDEGVYPRSRTLDARYLEAMRPIAEKRLRVAAIERYARILGDRSRSDAERAEALRFVVHFVGDAHQPLHAGYRVDRGGNNHQVRLGDKGTNLHTVWDFDVLGSRKLGWRKYALRLQPPARARAGGTPREWAEESCRITRDAGVYPRSRTLDARYLEAMRPIAEKRLRLAAIRLADLLDDALK